MDTPAPFDDRDCAPLSLARATIGHLTLSPFVDCLLVSVSQGGCVLSRCCQHNGNRNIRGGHNFKFKWYYWHQRERSTASHLNSCRCVCVTVVLLFVCVGNWSMMMCRISIGVVAPKMFVWERRTATARVFHCQRFGVGLLELWLWGVSFVFRRFIHVSDAGVDGG